MHETVAASWVGSGLSLSAAGQAQGKVYSFIPSCNTGGGRSWQRLDLTLTALFSDDWQVLLACLRSDQEGFKEPLVLRPGLPAGRGW